MRPLQNIRSALMFWLPVLVLTVGLMPLAHAARWSIVPRETIALDNGSYSPSELSGITYRRNANGLDEFLAIDDDGSSVFRLDLQISATGAVSSAVVGSAAILAGDLDNEGIAATADPFRVFISDEDGPGLRQVLLTFDSSPSSVLNSVTVPDVYDDIRGNRGFESLASWSVSTAGQRLAVANEEALTTDGSTAGLSSGTVVRVQKYQITGTNGQTSVELEQFAYEVDPIHTGTSTNGQTRSGLAELVALPDKTLLAVERSAGLGLPPFESRFYEIDSRAATDTSAATYDTGLAGQSYTPAAKELLWQGQAGGGLGDNLEGLAVGPQLANGNWLLVGVIDNGGGTNNRLVTFEAAPIVSADFTQDGDVTGLDFLQWQREFDPAVSLSDAFAADGNRDGIVDAADLALWQNHYATANPPPADVPEPSSVLVAGLVLAGLALRRARV